MRKTKAVAMALAAVMLISLLTSCSASLKKSTVVKEDDPWYESTLFLIEKDSRTDNAETFSCMCTSDDRIFYLYCFSKDRWGSSLTVIDTYDIDGKLLNRQDVSCPDGARLCAIHSINTDPEGKAVNAIVTFLGERNYGPAFTCIDPETGKLTVTKEALTKKVKRLKKSAVLSKFDFVGDYAVALYLDGSPISYVLDWKLFLYKDNEFVTELDMSSLSLGEFLSGYSIDESTDSLYAAAYEDDKVVSLEFDLKTGQLKNKKSIQDSDDSVNFAEYKATNDGDMCKVDSLGNIMKIDVNDMTPKTVIDTNWYSPFFCANIDADHIVVSDVISCNEERTIISESDCTVYGSDYSVAHGYIRILKKAEKNPHAGKKVLKLALPPNSGVSAYLARSIYEFNQSSTEYLIRLWDKYKTGFNVFRISGESDDEKQIYQMIQDLKGGDAPDIVIGIQKKHAMRDDVFMDLTGFLDPEVIEKQYKNVIEASKIDGKQFFLPVTLEIEGLVTNAGLLKDGAVGITFEEFDKMAKENMNGFSPYDYPCSDAYNKRAFILSCIDTKSAIEGKQIEFGTDQFKAAVKYAKDNFKYDDLKSMPREYLNDFNRYRGECYYAKIDDYLDYVHACFKEKGQYNIIGTPSVDASGPRFKALETISVSASTGEKDGCKKFLNYLFSGAAFNSVKPEFRLIVTNREIMERDIEAVSEYNNTGFAKYSSEVENGVTIPTVGVEKATGDKMATDGMRDLFLKSLSNLTTYYYEDKEITKFVFEEIAPYFTGDHSLEEAIAVLNDRTAKYIREL